MNEPLTQLHAEAMTAEREWTVEEIPVLSASISLPEPVPAADKVSRRIRRYYQLQCRSFLRYCETYLLPAAAEEYRERGCTVIYIAVSGAAAGFIALSDTLRPGMADTISAVREAGAEPVLLTCDHRNAAETIARELGIT